jgi:hypothetical protein
MPSVLRRTAIALLLALTMLTAAACSSPAPSSSGSGAAVITSEPTPSAAATAPAQPAQPAPTAPAGPIAVPGTGTALRAAILAAAAKGLGFSGKLTVIQLFAQDSAAVGDIRPATGPRMFFALTGGPDAWSIAWSAPFGSSLAKVASLKAAVPLVSPDLAAKLVWNKKAPAAAVKAPTLASLQAFALKSATSFAGASYTGTFTVTAQLAKSSKGSWWGNATAEPSDGSLESIGVWAHYANGKWAGVIADFSDPDAAATYFPADVMNKLGL